MGHSGFTFASLGYDASGEFEAASRLGGLGWLELESNWKLIFREWGRRGDQAYVQTGRR